MSFNDNVVNPGWRPDMESAERWTGLIETVAVAAGPVSEPRVLLWSGRLDGLFQLEGGRWSYMMIGPGGRDALCERFGGPGFDITWTEFMTEFLVENGGEPDWRLAASNLSFWFVNGASKSIIGKGTDNE